MLSVAFSVVYLNVDDVALFVVSRDVAWVDETAVRSHVECSVATKHFFMESRVNLHSIVVDELAASFVVAFTLDALHFAKELDRKSVV